MPGLGAGTAAMFNDASAPNSKEPQSGDMENCLIAGLMGLPPMGCFDTTSTGQMTARSKHTGGLQILLADGSTRFISENIDFSRLNTGCGTVSGRGLWQKLHTRGGGEVVGEFQERPNKVTRKVSEVSKHCSGPLRHRDHAVPVDSRLLPPPQSLA